MKKLFIVLAVLMFSSLALAEPPTTSIQQPNFVSLEVGILATSPMVTGEQVGIVPSFMLKQRVIEGFFTLQNLNTQAGTGTLDTTILNLGFGYELPPFHLFNLRMPGSGQKLPVMFTLDLLFAKDVVNGFENNSVIGAGLKFDRITTDNRVAFIVRPFWNRVRDNDSVPFKTVWSGSVAAEIKVM